MAQQEDSVGRVLEDVTDERNLRRIKERIPLGVVAMIAEARPSVLTDSAALCMRTGNALVYLGSRHSARTDGAMAEVLQETVASVGLPAALITNLPGDHRLSFEVVQQDRQVDLAIIRGRYQALREIKREATVPVLGAGPGNCHIYPNNKNDTCDTCDAVYPQVSILFPLPGWIPEGMPIYILCGSATPYGGAYPIKTKGIY